MTEFEQRWKVTMARAAELPKTPIPDLPPYFAARVLARSREMKSDVWMDLLASLGLRALGVAGCICVLSGSLALAQMYEFRMDRPIIEQSFTRELPWP
jgi:hypothetical protein